MTVTDCFRSTNRPERRQQLPGTVHESARPRRSELQNPGQFNYSFRGLGYPQESEYTLFRAFLNGLIDLAPRPTGYAGLSAEF